LNFFHKVIKYEPKLPMVNASKLRDWRRKKTFKDIFGYDWDFSVLTQTLWIYHKERKILFYHALWYSCNKSLDHNFFICVPKAHGNKNWIGWEKVRSKFKRVTLF
jgi:hypothetical protein